jgi:poly [ADP-ribose] polymerase
MVEALLQVQESQKLSKSLGPAAEQHPLDAMYAQLQCGLAPASEAEHEMVRRYAANTHGSTHDTYKINVKDVLAVSRAAEQPGFKASLANRQLLWHGSRLTNWAGILSQGLRIAPPEAPVTGYMFGKGVYFADMSSKSANYCGATSANPTAVLLLCDVALGSQYERLNAEYEAAESCKKAGKASTWGVGKFAPADGGASSIEGGAIRVPMGEAGDSEYMKANFARLQKAEGGKARAALLYNEYIVYDVSQIQMKYVVVCELEFDG